MVKDFIKLKTNSEKINEFNKLGNDLFDMLDKQQQKLNDSWAIRFSYSHFKRNLLVIYPKISFVRNIGFDSGTHNSTKSNIYTNQILNNKKNIVFENNLVLNQKLVDDFNKSNDIKFRLFLRIKLFFHLEKLG